MTIEILERKPPVASREHLHLQGDRIGAKFVAPAANTDLYPFTDRRAGQMADRFGIRYGHGCVPCLVIYERAQNRGEVSGGATTDIIRRLDQDHGPSVLGDDLPHYRVKRGAKYI